MAAVNYIRLPLVLVIHQQRALFPLLLVGTFRARVKSLSLVLPTIHRRRS